MAYLWLVVASAYGAPSGGNSTRRRLQSVARPRAGDRSFYDVAMKTNTDKIKGRANLQSQTFIAPDNVVEPKCRVFGHFYDSIYDRWMPEPSAARYQFLEIGYYNGEGFDAFSEFLPNAEAHSMEVSCLPPGRKQKDGFWVEWPWGNFARKNKRWEALVAERRLHCGDASSYDFLHATWTTHMRRPGAPPLMAVVDDGSHIASQMVATVFFWFPRIEPGGVLVVEDIQPTEVANPFRAKFLPQMYHDLHFCGNPSDKVQDVERFPTLRPLLKSIHCELHICVFERNGAPAVPDLSRALSAAPRHALAPMAFSGSAADGGPSARGSGRGPRPGPGTRAERSEPNVGGRDPHEAFKAKVPASLRAEYDALHGARRRERDRAGGRREEP